MNHIKSSLPLFLASVFGVISLVGLLFIPSLARVMTGWASFIAAIALLIGIFNLLSVHSRRLTEKNVYSGVLVLSLLGVVVLGATDYFGLTDGGVSTVFEYVQAPLEAAIASMLAFFLLFSGVRIVQRRGSRWAVIFIAAVGVFLLGRTPFPGIAGELFVRLSDFLNDVFVSAGMRGILIGIALGAIAVSIRVLMGTDRPYDR